MAAETIKYFGNQTLDNSEMVSKKADDAEQNAKDYADTTFVTKADYAADLGKKADTEYVDDSFIPLTDKLSANGDQTVNDMQNAVNANKVPTADAVVHYVNDKTKDVVDETKLNSYVKKADVTDIVTADTDKVPSDAAVKAELDVIKADVAAKADEAAVTTELDAIKASVATKADETTVKVAIAFASVKVGEVMDWFDVQEVTRNTSSDNPFEYTLDGEKRSVQTVSTAITLQIAQNVPDGWKAMNGLAELEADAYPELAAALPGNITATNHIWIPYMAHKIIKVKY